MTPHRCCKSVDYVVKKQTVSEIRYNAGPTETPASAVSRNLMGISETVRANLPSVTNLKRSVRQHRSKSRPNAPEAADFMPEDHITH